MVCYRKQLNATHAQLLEKLRPIAFSLQNRRDFLRISGEQGRRRGKREANAKRELRARGGSLKEFFSEPPLARNSRFAFASRLPRLRPCSPEIRKKSRLFCRLDCFSRNVLISNDPVVRISRNLAKR